MSGYLDAAIYVLLTSVAFVFLDHLIVGLNPVVALFAMSAIALIVFNSLNISNLKKTYLACWHNKTIYLMMSAALAVDWVTMVFASHIADPFIAMAALFSALALFGFGKIYLIARNKAVLFSLFLLLLGLGILLFAYQVKTGHSIIGGVILGSIAGLAFYVYIANSSKLASLAHLSSLQVLATRFWLLFFGAVIFVPKHNLLFLLKQNLLSLVIISLGSLIIPIYYNQQAIKKLGSELTSVFISLVPPVTYGFYAIYNRQIIMVNVVVCILITLALIIPNLVKVIRR
ncbi:MAG: hypothetical protein EKK54_06730 [Neisseriaceae bacterium]|nr:MAG: hypothetical protein EKK54_06730 [Neisseriaceae bacterium]